MSKQQQTVNYTGPFITMVVLMSLVGFLTVLNAQFQAPLQKAFLSEAGALSNTFAVLCTFAFFFAYFVWGNTGAKIVNAKGYKKTLIYALLILVGGLGIFELSAFQFNSTAQQKHLVVKVEKASEAKFIDDIKTLFSIENKEVIVDTVAMTPEMQAQFDIALEGVVVPEGMQITKEDRIAIHKGEKEIKECTISSSSIKFGENSTVPFAFFIFLLGSFVAGTAMTFLQVVVNPYLVACSVPGTSGVQRQTIAGAGNSTMSTLAPLFVTYVIFAGQTDIQIASLYVPFGVLMLLVAAIAFGLSKVELPEIAGTTANKNEVLPKSVWSFSHLSLGVVAIFFYVGVEVAVGANIIMWAKELPNFVEVAAIMASLYFGGMLIGRLFGSFISKVPANVQLTVASIGAAILIALSLVTRDPRYMIGVGLCHSIMWPAIFALAIEGLGRYTSKGSGALMLGVVGGAVLPLIQGTMADSTGWLATFWIVFAAEIYLLYYALVGCKVKQKDI